MKFLILSFCKVFALPIVIFSPIFAIKATRLSLTVFLLFIIDLSNSFKSEEHSLFNSLNSCTNLIKSSLLEVNCETDFVAKNDDFIKFVKELSLLNSINSSDLKKLELSKMQNDKTVKDNLVGLIAKIGEKITIGRTKTLENENFKNFTYQHSIIKDNVSKLAVIVSLEFKEISEKINTFGKQLAMHIAASNPIALTPDEIDKDILTKEQNLISEELKNSGKTEEIAKKISLGKLSKFKEENSLMTQNWVMEPKKKVKDILLELNTEKVKIQDFIRFKIGE